MAEQTTEEPRYKNGRLTHAGMHKVLDEGGSVSFNGRIISRRDHLPSEAEVAAASGDQEAIKRAAERTQERAKQVAADQRRLELAKSGAGQAGEQASSPSGNAKK